MLLRLRSYIGTRRPGTILALSSRMPYRQVFVVLCVLLARPAAAQVVPEDRAPLSIGETFVLESAVLDEARRINVYAPAAYAASDTVRLPVLYMPDGGIAEDFLHIAGLVQILSLNKTMRPFLLVGIENTERRRDLTGPTENEADRAIAPRVGGSAAFRRFIRDELMPTIEATYRTTSERAIVGESLAGLFVVESLLLEPDLFDTYIAVDPSLWWNDEHLVARAPAFLAGRQLVGKTLYLAAGSQPEIAAATSALAAALRAGGPDGPAVQYRSLPDEPHHAIYHPAALVAFRTVFAPARPGD